MLLAGGRMAEVPSQGYTLFDIPKPKQFFVHVHADANELGRVYSPDIAINASPQSFCAALGRLKAPQTIAWAEQTKAARAEYLAFTDVAPEAPGKVQLSQIMLWLRNNLPEDAIVANGAGNYAIWVGRYLRIRQYGTLARSGFGLNGLWIARRRRCKARKPRSHGGQLQWRWLLSHERAGVCDCGSV